jgi:serine/threonine protein kinase
MHANIGKYEIRGLLGKGATASVYLASDLSSSARSRSGVDAMPPIGGGEAPAQVLQNEASLAGKLHTAHRQHLRRRIGEKGNKDVLYLVMELVEGTSLQPHCDPADLLPAARTAQIVYKCCKALEYANTVGVVHRDIKPANIMLRPDFDIKVSDFGAAQLARSDTTQVAGVGSPAYMSPEQIRGGEEIDFRSDMFSLGGVMYHMLTGARPFGGNTAWELMAILSGTRRRLRRCAQHPPRSTDRAARARQVARRRFELGEFAARLNPALRWRTRPNRACRTSRNSTPCAGSRSSAALPTPNCGKWFAAAACASSRPAPI